MNVRAGVLVVLIAAGTLAACGESGGQSTAAAPTTLRDEGTGASSGTAGPKGSTPTPAPQGAAVIPLPNAWDILVTGPGGYRFDVRLEVADKIVKVGSRHGELVAGETCKLDSRKDALIPAQVTLTNSTPGFAAAPRVTFYFPTFGDAVEVGPSSKGGAACRSYEQSVSSSRFSVSSPAEIATGQRHQREALIVVKNYYTPANPNGDIAALRRIMLGISSSAASTEQVFDAKLVAGPSMPGRSGGGWPLPIGSLVTV